MKHDWIPLEFGTNWDEEWICNRCELSLKRQREDLPTDDCPGMKLKIPEIDKEADRINEGWYIVLREDGMEV